MTINAKPPTQQQKADADAEKIKRIAQETTEAIKKAGDDLRAKWVKEEREQHVSHIPAS